MPRQRLADALRDLHEQLESSDRIEADDRKALLQAMGEIQEALERTGTESEDSGGGPLSRRVTALVEDFETSHPKLAEILSSVSETLSNLGI